MIWGNYLGDKMVKTTSTVHLRTFASLASTEKKIIIYFINKDERAQNIHVYIGDAKIKSVVQAWELFGKNADDCEPVWQKKEVSSNINDLQVKGTSITVIE